MSFTRIKFIHIVFFAAIVLRLVLALLNREANDNHVEITNFILEHHRLPEKTECWECAQPKLYYVLSAGLIKLFKYGLLWKKIVLMQYLSALSGIIGLFFTWKLIQKQKLSVVQKNIIFILV